MSRKGFTLIELMIVIAIVGILAMSIFNLDFNKKTDTEKRDRMVHKVESMIHSTFLSSLSGRGIKQGNAIINPTSTRVLLSPVSQNLIGVYYYSGASRIGSGEVLQFPFFGDQAYTLTGMYYKNKDLSSTVSITSPIEIIFTSDNGIAFSGATSASGVIIGMSLGYRNSQKKLEFDRRFGKIDIQ